MLKYTIAIIVMFVVSLSSLPSAVAEAEGQAEGQTIAGTIQIVATKVKTEGAKSDKEVIVYLEKVEGEFKLVPPAKPAIIDQKGLVFVPHILAVQKGTTVTFKNSDAADHNVFCVDKCCKLVDDINSKKPKFLDLGNFPGGKEASYTFTLPGAGVILCKLHPEMAAYVVVLESPHFTVAIIDGETQSATFSISNVPPGKYLLKTWNKRTESPGMAIEVAAADVTDVKIEMARKKKKPRKKRKK